MVAHSLRVSYVPETKLFLSVLLCSVALGVCLYVSTTLL